MINLKKNILLNRYTTFRIGGRAKYFIDVKNREDLKQALAIALEKKISFLVIGNGSNLLVSDKGYDGIVIKMSGKKIISKGEIINVESGVLLPFLSFFCAKSGLSGLEWASGIPGTVGGAIRGNAGAFGVSMADIVTEVTVISAKSGKVSTLKNKQCEFGYRESLFKKNPELIIIEAKIKFLKEDSKKINAKIKQHLDYRKERHPIEPSAGSIFKALELSKKERVKISQKFPEIEKFNDVVPAAFLIDRCGLRGKRLGDAMISELHANFVVNVGKAKAEDVKNIIFLIKKRVKSKFGLSLEEEIEYVGF